MYRVKEAGKPVLSINAYIVLNPPYKKFLWELMTHNYIYYASLVGKGLMLKTYMGLWKQ